MNIIAKSASQCQEILNIEDKFSVRILNLLIEWDHRYKSTFLTHQFIADKIDSSVSTVKRKIDKLVSMNLIKTTSRSWRASCFEVSPIFKQYAPLLKEKFTYLKRIVTPKFLMDLFGDKSTLKNRFLINFELRSNKELYKYPVDSNTKRERYIPEPTYIPKDGVVLKILSRKGKSMSEFKPSSELQAITKEINLSRHGQIKLSIFSGVILSQALSSYKKLNTKPNKPYDWVFLAAKTLSETHGISINWESYYSLKEQYNINDNAPMVLPKTVKALNIQHSDYIDQPAKDKDKVVSLMEKAKNNPDFYAKQQYFFNLLKNNSVDEQNTGTININSIKQSFW